MSHGLALALMILCDVVGLALVPLGLPGLWVMVLGVIAYGGLTHTAGVAIIATVLGVAFLGEVVEWWLGFRLAERYGGSRRAGWGAVVGRAASAAAKLAAGLVIAIVGLIPVFWG